MGEKIYGYHAIEEAIKKAGMGSTLFVERGGSEKLETLVREAKLTTMKIDTFAIGRKAVEVLQESLNGTDSYAPETVLVSPVFQLGETMN